MSDGENERAMIQTWATRREMPGSRRRKNIRTYAHPSAPRAALREAGIARMAPTRRNPSSTNSKATSSKPFVTDASGFTSNPRQNPTLTIMSLAVRSCDYLMSEMKKPPRPCSPILPIGTPAVSTRSAATFQCHPDLF
jgi:hypothetical protein